MTNAPEISVALPIYNEEESVPVLCQKLHDALSALGRTYEIVLVDDGSKDGSWAAMCEAARKFPHLRLVRFRRNFGQTAALAAGFFYPFRCQNPLAFKLAAAGEH